MKCGRLFCRVCTELLCAKKSSEKNHVKSAKHEKSKAAFTEFRAKRQTLQDVLRRNAYSHPKGESLPLEIRLWRVQKLESFLAASIPLKRVNHNRYLFEMNLLVFLWSFNMKFSA